MPRFEEAVRFDPRHRGDVDLGECPVTALGYNAGRYYFLVRNGQVVDLHYRELTSVGGLLSLFAGNDEYLAACWPQFDKLGNLTGGFNVRAAAAGLIRLATDQGIWSGETPVRGRGLWRLSDGRLAFHAGDRLVLSTGETLQVGQRIGEVIFAARSKISPPANEPASTQRIKEWRRDFDYWRFEPLGLGGVNSDRGPDNLATDCLFGAVCLSILGAATDWRTHCLIRAVHGAGKTTLLDFIAAGVGDLAVQLNDFSEAGLRQSLTSEGRPVLLDEGESDPSGRMSEAIRLIRRMSGGAGVRGARGTREGIARRYDLAGSCFLFAINAPALAPQDLSRWMVFEMLPAVASLEAEAHRAIDRAADAAPGIKLRAILGWDRFRINLKRLRAALLRRRCTPRQADQLGSVLAAGAMMLEDEPIDPGWAEDLAENAAAYIEATQEEETDNGDARRCWLQLMTHTVQVWRSGEASTIQELLLTAQCQNAVDMRNTLAQNYGMRIVQNSSASFPEAPCLYIVNQSAFLKRVYAGTPWADGGWRQSLVRLDGAAPSKKPIRVGGVQQRCVAVPMRHLPARDASDECDDEPAPG